VGVVSWKRDSEGQIVGVEERAVRFPGLLSIFVSGDFLHPQEASETEVKGLAELPPDDFLRRRHPGASDEALGKLRPRYWPNVPVVFQTYHLMIALGVALVGVAPLACVLWRMGKLWDTRSRFVRAFLWLLVLTPVLAEIATQAGWYTAEVGRQSWVVYEVLKTSDAASAVVKASLVLRSIILFSVVYVLLRGLFISLLIRMIRKGSITEAVATDLPETWQPLSLKAGRRTEG